MLRPGLQAEASEPDKCSANGWEMTGHPDAFYPRLLDTSRAVHPASKPYGVIGRGGKHKD